MTQAVCLLERRKNDMPPGQPKLRATLGLANGELAFDQDCVPSEDAQQMRSVFDRFTAALGTPCCCGLVRELGNELVLQIGDKEPYSVPIPSDIRPREARFESALSEELARRFSK
jgi:hypothetical protein